MNKEAYYTVKQLATMAGVSARTLHYYDQIGLLKASRNRANDYRIYDRPALLRLQQILFLRELGMSLEDIRDTLDQPGFDLLGSLRKHRLALQARQERLTALISTVERTISHMKGSIEMEDKQLFEGFSAEQEKEYSEEAVRRWGEKARESQKLWASYSAEKKKQIGAEGDAVYRDLVKAMALGPTSPEAQSGIARWHQHLRYFYEPTPQILLGLADGYCDDPRFRATFDHIHPDLAEFMRKAIQHYCAGL
jgi:MerR family transcriptional regulator, thiopeptide resistance regulator